MSVKLPIFRSQQYKQHDHVEHQHGNAIAKLNNQGDWYHFLFICNTLLSLQERMQIRALARRWSFIETGIALTVILSDCQINTKKILEKQGYG